MSSRTYTTDEKKEISISSIKDANIVIPPTKTKKRKWQLAVYDYTDNRHVLSFYNEKELTEAFEWINTYLRTKKSFKEKESNCIQGNVFIPNDQYSGSSCYSISSIDGVDKFGDDMLFLYPLKKEIYYILEKQRDLDFQQLKEALKGTGDKKEKKSTEKLLPKIKFTGGKKTMLDSIKGYYKDHEDVLFPLLIVIVLDHFFNNGGLRERIVNLTQGLLDGIQTKLDGKQLISKEKK